MSRFDRRLLPASALMAAIVTTSSIGVAQSPAAASTAPTKSAIQQSPVQPTQEQIGDSLMAHQRYQAAIEAYKKAPNNNPDVWNKMGIAYQLMFNLTDAMHCYRTSYKLNSRNSTVLNNLGTVYDALKQYHNAEKMYRKALKLDPQSALIRKNLGTNLLGQHKYQKGWAEYVAALKLDPQIFDYNARPRIENPASVSDRGAMNFYMAKGCVRAGMPERAVEYLRMAINEGYTSPKKIIADNEFATLHNLPAFQELISSETQKRQ
jgi:tetratricopeptide (TPR) repeat protein